jgi:5-methylcytosine-specific restriction endonuclease McrA
MRLKLSESTIDELNKELSVLNELYKQYGTDGLSAKQWARVREITILLDSDRKTTQALKTRMKRDGVKKYRKHVLNANGNKCYVCGCSFLPVLVVHHVKPVSEGGNNELDNLVVLCPTCHAVVHILLRNKMQNRYVQNLAIAGELEDHFLKRQALKIVHIAISQQKKGNQS